MLQGRFTVIQRPIKGGCEFLFSVQNLPLRNSCFQCKEFQFLAARYTSGLRRKQSSSRGLKGVGEDEACPSHFFTEWKSVGGTSAVSKFDILKPPRYALQMKNKTMCGVNFKSKIGTLGIVAEGDAISAVYFGACPPDVPMGSSPVLEDALRQFGEYFDGKRKVFDLPLLLDGTSFQVSVWKQLSRIKYGKTKTYGKIAETLDRKGSARPVGMACRQNPIPIIIPCHRVIGQDGSLTGFAAGLEAKEFLLDMEKAVCEAESK
jgi:methylated-DNA-[protein]-cysteine S-methyltransferase